MSSPSINIGINNQGKALVEIIDTHFRCHEPEFYKNFILSSSIELENDKNILSNIKDGEFEISSDNDVKRWFDFELYGNIKNLVSLVNDSFINAVIVNIVIPLAEENSVLLLNNLLEAVKELNNDQQISGVEVKIFTIMYSLDQQDYKKNTQIKNELLLLEKLTIEYDTIINDIYYLDDRNTDKITLNLNLNWLAFALGEFFVFQMLSHTSLAIQNKSKIFGLGVIHFNEVLFRSVISNKILQYKFEQEGVIEQEGVQLRDVIQTCNPFINGYQNFFQKFLEKYPKTTENNENLTANSKTYINEFKEGLETFVTDKNYTIGESKVILANLLGEDDHKVEGIHWVDERLNINDLEFDIINYFNKYVVDEHKVDFIGQKILRDSITELTQSIKSDKKSLKSLEEKSNEIHSDLDIAFDEGVFSVNGKRINASGYIPSVINSNDEFYTYEDGPISKFVDLTKYFSKVKDQGQLASCTAFPVAAVYEFAAKQNAKNVDISELFIYYNTRVLRGDIDEDSGATLLETINAVKVKGACYTENHPYTFDSFLKIPSAIAFTEAQHQIVEKACRVDITEKDFKHAISSGHPVIIGLKLFKSFYPKNKSAVVPYPSKNEAQYEDHGNHALLIVGFNDDEKLFKVRNSWGITFGENGYCYIPYDYITNSDFCLEAFIITSIVDLSYSEFNYDANTSFAFLADSLIRIKTIKEYNLRAKEKELNKIKKDFDLIALKNEENTEQIKSPLFRKRILEKLNEDKIPTTKEENIQVDNTSIKPDTKKKIALFFILGGIILILLSIFLKFYITATGTIIGSLVGIALLILGCNKLFKKREQFITPIKVDQPKVEESLYEQDLYSFVAADLLFSQFDEMNKDLIIRYKALSSYFSKIKHWQKEIEDILEQIEYSSPTFVVNVVEKKPLLEYIEKEKEMFLKNLPNLSVTFHNNYVPKENNSDEIFEKLREKYLDDIQKNIENILDISIVDYIQGVKKYPYFNDAPPLSNTISNVYKVSKPFCNIKQTMSSLSIQNYVIHEKILRDSEAKLQEFSKHRNASIQPVLSFRENKKKYVAIQVAALNDISDLVRYKL
jgi:C1A family cysteine protease